MFRLQELRNLSALNVANLVLGRALIIRALTLFCSTSLPLASTGWVVSTIKLCIVHLPFSSALSIYSTTLKSFLSEKDIQSRDLIPGQLGLKASTLTTVLYCPPRSEDLYDL